MHRWIAISASPVSHVAALATAGLEPARAVRQMGRMEQSPPATARIDHLVLPVAALSAARARHAALGFTVAPDGVHPFGTTNACIYLADGSFLEPLAVADGAAYQDAADAGNVFVARDRAFRLNVAAEGCSALVLASDDAAADHARFMRDGVSAGPVLEFSRPFIDAAGRRDTASFRLAFARLARAEESFLFACQRLNAPNVDRTALSSHPNGVSGLAGVVLVADDPDGAARAVAGVAGAPARPGETILLGRTWVECLRPDAYTDRFGPPPPHRGCGYALVSFGARDIGATRALLKKAGIVHRDAGGAILVPRAGGQGVDYLFEEAP